MLYASNGMVKTAGESCMGVVAAGYAMNYIEVIHQSQQKLFFMVIHDLVYFMTCFGQLGYLQEIHTMYELLGKKLST